MLNFFLLVAQYLAIIIYIIIALFCFSSFLDLYIFLVLGLLILPSALYIQGLKSSYLLIIINIFSYIVFSIAIILFKNNQLSLCAIILVTITVLFTIYLLNYKYKQNTNNLIFISIQNNHKKWILFCYFCFPALSIIRVTNPIYIISIAMVFLFIIFFEILFIYNYTKNKIKLLKQFIKCVSSIMTASAIITFFEFFTFFKIAWGLNFNSNLENDIIGSVIIFCYIVIMQISLLYIYVRLSPRG